MSRCSSRIRIRTGRSSWSCDTLFGSCIGRRYEGIDNAVHLRQ